MITEMGRCLLSPVVWNRISKFNIMKSTIRYEFDNTNFFLRDYAGPRSIEFDDPAVIPATGDKMQIRIEEFFEYNWVVSNYEDQVEG